MSELTPLILKSLGSVSSSNDVLSINSVLFNGNIYVTGGFKGKLDIGGNVPPITTSKEGGGFIAKYTNSLVPLALVGTVITNPTGLSLYIGIAISNDGDVYITGSFDGTLNIGGNVPPINSKGSSGFVAKYTNSLVPVNLVGLIGGSSKSLILSWAIAVGNNGDIYVTGAFDDTLNIGGGVPPITTIGRTGEFIAKYNNSLVPLALKGTVSTNPTDSQFSTSLAIAQNGDVYVLGIFSGTLNIGGGVPPITTKSTSDIGSGFIAKYTNSLSPLALKGLVATNPTDESVCLSLAIGNNGDIYVNGTFTGTLNVGGGIPPITNINKEYSGFLLVLNSNLKSISLNSILNESLIASVITYKNILIDYSTGELILTGTFIGKTDIGGGVPPITLSGDTVQGVFLAKYLNNIEPICLVADTPITTDQGIVLIQNIDKAIHTIGGKRIVAITKAITPEKSLICFEQHCMGINLPNRRTIMTPGHEVLYKGKLVQAKHFVGKIDGVHTVPYDGKVVYNVLLEKHGLMSVNNMTVETLHPENKVAKMILKSL
jgi:hypothetical protein